MSSTELGRFAVILLALSIGLVAMEMVLARLLALLFQAAARACTRFLD